MKKLSKKQITYFAVTAALIGAVLLAFLINFLVLISRQEIGAVYAMIKPQYSDRFFAENFGVSEFDYINVESIEYVGWDEENECGIMKVHLKKKGKIFTEHAVNILPKVAFVESVSIIYRK